MRRKPGRGPRGDQRWRTFLRNHAADIVACDFCVAVTASFRVLYIFVIIVHASRRPAPLQCDVESDGSLDVAAVAREAIASEHPYRFLVHDRDSIYTQALGHVDRQPAAPSAENTLPEPESKFAL